MVQTQIGPFRLLVAAGLVAAVGGGLAATGGRDGFLFTREAAREPAPGPQPAGAAPPDAPERVAAAPVPAEPASVPFVDATLPAEADPAAADDDPAPSFDVVRVTPEGAALVAGRAEPGARVTVRAGEQAVAEVEAGPSGEFVALFQAPPAAAPQPLSLESAGSGAASVSRETVLLIPPAPAAPPTETAEPAAVAEAGPDAAPEGEVAATAIVREDTVEVLPAPAGGPPARVSLASISYAAEGTVRLAGFGPAGSAVRVYVDGDYSAEGTIGTDGRWGLALGDIAAGVYRLRVDEVGSDGRVASRVETPFQRDFPDTGEAAGTGEGSITVQPGNNLWTIAREHYGQGVLYTQIFTANAELIRDPELIYPGQIFVLPTVEGLPGPVQGPRPRG